jgi:hypothetical protein
MIVFTHIPDVYTKLINFESISLFIAKIES